MAGQEPVRWHTSLQLTESRAYKCYYCDHEIATQEGFAGVVEVPDRGRPHHPPIPVPTWIYICHYCGNPTFFVSDGQLPAPLPGRRVEKVPRDVGDLLLEARRAIAAQAPTAAAMVLRKILMNVAVNSGAGTDRQWNFEKYVDYLAESSLLPPNGQGWVDKIRTFGNEAAHEIHEVAQEDAETALSRVTSMLHFMYEMMDEEEPQTLSPDA